MQVSESPTPYRISTKPMEEFMGGTEKPINGLMETRPYMTKLEFPDNFGHPHHRQNSPF
jgi:hypothetical protein